MIGGDKMKHIEIQKENIKALLKLIEENPDLEILPMVDTDCVGGDDYGSWAAQWGSSRVDEYYCGDERIYFRSGDYDGLVEEWIDNNYDQDEYKNLSDDELDKIAEEKVKGYDWVKAIVVYIDEIN